MHEEFALLLSRIFALCVVTHRRSLYALFVIHDTLQGTREQLAVVEFAQALLVIPRTLAVNGAFDATDLVAQLRAYHHAAQHGSAEEKVEGYKYTGTCIDNGWPTHVPCLMGRAGV